MKRVLVMLGLCVALCAPAHAQQKVQFFPVITEGEVTFVGSLQWKSGFELWSYKAPTGTWWEVISPQFIRDGPDGRFGAGLYARLQEGELQRFGLAGSLRLGRADGWQLAGPWYLFIQRTEDSLSAPSFWTPNLRLSYPVTKRLRMGWGAAVVLSQGFEPVAVTGPYLQLKLSRRSDLQLRIGRFVSPSTQAGQWQVFSGVTTYF